MGLLSFDNVLRELAFASDMSYDLDDFLDRADSLLEVCNLNEADYSKITKRLKMEILDIEKYVSRNDCKCVTNPRPFSSDGYPSPDGLLSNQIFGFTMKERSGTYAYIDLHGWFLDPSCYKTWMRLDPKIKNIVHGVKYYRIDEKGYIVEDEDGETGIDFLRKNIKRIKFKENVTITKEISVDYLEKNRDKMFIRKYLVIPPFYRDKNTSTGARKTVGLGGINKIYNNLIVAANALTATQDYGFDASDSMKGRVQELILSIYDFCCGNRNKNLPADSVGQGLSGKTGIMHKANMSKTSNYSSRLVISAPELKVNKPEDLMVNYDKSAVPLYAVITQFRDFVMFNARTFFENEFRGAETYPVVDAKGNLKAIVPDAPEINFSDERIKKEMDRFLHGYNNRFIPIEIPVEGTNETYYMSFKGRGWKPGENPEQSGIVNRRLTWCDVFFIAAVEAVRDKQILITRFPIDYFSNQFTTGVEVSSTKETEEIEFNGVNYKYYPKIREQDMYKDTSNAFVDTLRFSNCYLSGIGGDYDGDQCTCKGVYTREANDEYI